LAPVSEQLWGDPPQALAEGSVPAWLPRLCKGTWNAGMDAKSCLWQLFWWSSFLSVTEKDFTYSDIKSPP